LALLVDGGEVCLFGDAVELVGILVDDNIPFGFIPGRDLLESRFRGRVFVFRRLEGVVLFKLRGVWVGGTSS
jgi:hypothetical protein